MPLVSSFVCDVEQRIPRKSNGLNLSFYRRRRSRPRRFAYPPSSKGDSAELEVSDESPDGRRNRSRHIIREPGRSLPFASDPDGPGQIRSPATDITRGRRYAAGEGEGDRRSQSREDLARLRRQTRKRAPAHRRALVRVRTPRRVHLHTRRALPGGGRASRWRGQLGTGLSEGLPRPECPPRPDHRYLLRVRHPELRVGDPDHQHPGVDVARRHQLDTERRGPTAELGVVGPAR